MTDKEIIRHKYLDLRSRVDSVINDCEMISTETKLDALGQLITSEENRIRKALEARDYAEVANLNRIKFFSIGLDYVYSEFLGQENNPQEPEKS